MLFLLLLGVFVGLVFGFIGVGGGIVVLFLLMYGVGLSMMEVLLIVFIVVGMVVFVVMGLGLCEGIVWYWVVLVIGVVGMGMVFGGIWLVYCLFV